MQENKIKNINVNINTKIIENKDTKIENGYLVTSSLIISGFGKERDKIVLIY